MKLKNFLIEFGYWLGMILGLIFLARSCAELSHAQHRLNNVRPATPQRGYVFYKRNDSLFAKLSGGREVYLIADSTYLPLDTVKIYGWITDSIKWVPVGGLVIYEGIKCDVHDWVYDDVVPGRIGEHCCGFRLVGTVKMLLNCLSVNPDGKHCNEHQSATRERICRNCLRSEIEREQWFQHFIERSKTEFELLKEKQRSKQ